MVIKLTYGLQASLPAYLNSRNAASSQQSKVSINYEHHPSWVSLNDALTITSDGSTIEDREITLEKIISTNKELIQTIDTLISINFLKLGDEVDVHVYVPEDKRLAEFEPIDIDSVRASVKNLNICLTTYKFEGESELIDILHAKKVIKSKTWNTAGEYFDDDEIVSIKSQKPVEFKELRTLIQKVCAHMTEQHYKLIMSDCVEVKSDTHYNEDGEGWTDYSWYEVRMMDLEKYLQKLGYLTPFLRKIAVDNILALM